MTEGRPLLQQICRSLSTHSHRTANRMFFLAVVYAFLYFSGIKFSQISINYIIILSGSETAKIHED